MSKFRHLLLFWVLIFQVFSVHAQTPEPQNQQPKSWLIYQDEISKLWKIQNEFFSHNNLLEGDQLFKQILFLKENYELEQIPPLSMALLRKIPPQKTLTDKAKHPYFQMAQELSPGHYSNDYFLCDFFADPVEWPKSAKHCFDGLTNELSLTSEKLIFLTKVSYQAFWTILILLLFYLVLYIRKFLPFTIQYYSSTFYWISPISYLFLISIISLLILFTFGWLFFFAFFYIFLWRFPSNQEKGLLFFLICLAMVLPFTFAAPALSKQFHTGILFDLLHSEQTLNPAKFEEKIVRYSRTHPNDPYALFSLGVMAKKTGNLSEAQRYFELSRSVKGDFFKTKINLANIQYDSGDTEGAKEEFKKLISLNPTFVIPYLNLSQIYTHESQYLEGENYMNQAKKIDEIKFKKLTQSMDNRNGLVRLIYEELEPKDLSPQIFKRGEEFQFHFLQYFSRYFPKYSPGIYYGTLLFSVLMAILFQFATNTRNYYLLYFNREKNLENLTLVQLRDYPAIYKKFAASMELKERLRFWTGVIFPGFYAFDEEKLVKSVFMAASFYFFLSGYFIDNAFPKINDGFPWKNLNICVTLILWIINMADVRLRHGKKKN